MYGCFECVRLLGLEELILVEHDASLAMTSCCFLFFFYFVYFVFYVIFLCGCLLLKFIYHIQCTCLVKFSYNKAKMVNITQYKSKWEANAQKRLELDVC